MTPGDADTRSPEALPLENLKEKLEAQRRKPNPFQFSLSELLLMVVLSAVALGMLRLMPADYAAGLAGLVALSSLVVLLWIPMPRPSLYLAWWIILAIYVLTAVVAALRGPEHF